MNGYHYVPSDEEAEEVMRYGEAVQAHDPARNHTAEEAEEDADYAGEEGGKTSSTEDNAIEHAGEQDVHAGGAAEQDGAEEEEDDATYGTGRRSNTRRPDDDEDDDEAVNREESTGADAANGIPALQMKMYETPMYNSQSTSSGNNNNNNSSHKNGHAHKTGKANTSSNVISRHDDRYSPSTSRRRSSTAGISRNTHNNGNSSGIAATPRSTVSGARSPRVCRSASLVSVARTTDSRNITKENHNSLIADPQVQDLRRQSLLTAARYRSARRASSLSNSMGLAEVSSSRANSPCRSGSARSIGGSRATGGALSPAEAYALESIAANDEHRLETYARAQEIALERQFYIVDQGLEKMRRSEDNYVRLLNERDARAERTQLEREKRMAEAAQRRQELDEARLHAVEERIARKAAVESDAYGPVYARSRYASFISAHAGRGIARGSHSGSIAPAAAAASNGNGRSYSAAHDDSYRASTPRRRMPAATPIEHPRGWR